MLTLALLTFAQASVAFSSCSMDRGTMSPVMAADKDKSAADCETPMDGARTWKKIAERGRTE